MFLFCIHKLSYNFWRHSKGTSIKLLLLPILLYANWEFLSSFIELGISNPFANIFLISGYLPDSKPDDPHYRKTYWDIAFLIYHIVFFSFTREMVAIYISKPAAKYFGIKRSKFDRFGEQAYALFYFVIFGAWGYVRVFLDCFFLPV
jgi:acyl-CoA-dependent ceramide synthase